MSVMAIIVEPLSGTVGAQVRGVDLSVALDEGTVAEIWRAFLDHHVLFFRDQDLSPEAQMRFGRCFGELDTHPFVEGMAAYPEVIEVVTEPDDRFNFGGGWHSDVSFLEEPDLGSISLRGRCARGWRRHAVRQPTCRVPTGAVGDDRRAWSMGSWRRTRPPAQYSEGGYSTRSKAMKTKSAGTAAGIVRHPLVRSHPETGRRHCTSTRAFTIGIEGMRKEEWPRCSDSCSTMRCRSLSRAASDGHRGRSRCGTIGTSSPTGALRLPRATSPDASHHHQGQPPAPLKIPPKPGLTGSLSRNGGVRARWVRGCARCVHRNRRLYPTCSLPVTPTPGVGGHLGPRALRTFRSDIMGEAGTSGD